MALALTRWESLALFEGCSTLACSNDIGIISVFVVQSRGAREIGQRESSPEQGTELLAEDFFSTRESCSQAGSSKGGPKRGHALTAQKRTAAWCLAVSATATTSFRRQAASSHANIVIFID